MKRLLLIFSLITLSHGVFAQWFVGIKAGPTISNYKTKTPWKEVSNFGYTFGGVAYKQMTANIGVAVELQYIQKGYYHKVCNTIYDKLKANYLEVPIMLDYTFIIPGLKNFKAHGNVGIYTAYWMSGKYKTQIEDETITETFEFDNNEASRFDFGPNAGGRIEYILKSASLSLDLRYELGLLDLQKKVNDNTSNTNRSFIIGICYMKVLGL
jgi:hypothetical protein